MPKQSRTIEAFIDRGFPDTETFCTQFLYSSEFSLSTLKDLVRSGKSRQKYDLAVNLSNAIETNAIDSNQVLLAFVQQPRKWLSLKLGHYTKLPILKSAITLFTEFGDEGWYGPIEDTITSRKWYIRSYRIPYYEQTYQTEGVSEFEIAERTKSVATYQIRWTVIAEIGETYAALSWNGFQHNELTSDLFDPEIKSLMQFPYWLHVPKFFKEFEHECEATWKHPILHQLVLGDLWDKYLSNTQYIWRHLRIRADNRGVELNAHSTGAFEQEHIQMRGLQALSRHLAYSALNSLNIQETPQVVNSVENSLLRTLIQEWGTKSYEFSLDKIFSSGEKQQSLFRAHCYFAEGPSSSPQDSFQHLLCFTKNYGGSSQSLRFLLSELGY